MHAQNLPRDLQAKSIIRFVVKWREFQGNKKKSDNFDLLALICSQGTTTHAEYKFIHFQANRSYNIILCTKTTLSVFVEHLGVLYEACSPLILPER